MMSELLERLNRFNKLLNNAVTAGDWVLVDALLNRITHTSIELSKLLTTHKTSV